MEPKVPHGTRHGYTRHRCRCTECTAANAEYQRQWSRRRRRPDATEPTTADATEALAELDRLAGLGWSRREVARRSGLSRSTLDAVATGAVTTVLSRTLEALRALDGEAGAGSESCDAVAARSALEALRRAGYTDAEVAAVSGLGGDSARVRVRRGAVRYSTHRRVVDALTALGGTVGDRGEVVVAPLPAVAARELAQSGRGPLVALVRSQQRM